MEEEKNIENQKQNNKKNKNIVIVIMGLVILILLVVICILLFVNGSGNKNSNNNEQNNAENYNTNSNLKDELIVNENLKIENNILTVFKTNSDAGQVLVIIDKDGNQRYDDINVSLYSDRFVLNDDKLYYIDNSFRLNRYDFNTKENYNYNIEVDHNAYRIIYVNDKIIVCGNTVTIYDVSKPNTVKVNNIDTKISSVITAYDEKEKSLYFVNVENQEHFIKKINLSGYSAVDTDINNYYPIEDTGIKGSIINSFDNYFVYTETNDGNLHIYEYKTNENKEIEEKNPIFAINNFNDYYYTINYSKDSKKTFSKIVHKNGEKENVLFEEKDEKYYLDYIGKSGKYIILKEYEKDYSSCSKDDDVCEPLNINIKYYLLDINNYELKKMNGVINNYDINDFMIW